ncbi:TonB-dependent receptor plug domain-containing protein [Sphingomicrobium sp. XHP0239]|uniref:TonB-dependent receptor plug domain-containing protein n=1 Tax=Sphingomicrobium maritimum TaxID=3133972 RepID=UPI0031CC76C0
MTSPHSGHARLCATVASSLVLLSATPAWSQALPPVSESEEADDNDDRPIIIYGRAIDRIGVAQSGSQGTVGFADFENIPISRTGELVENVPGVIATQHSGNGKANQYFLRGFNLDHGTDFAGFVDGVPINMRSHGHGQGYLDFNFIIPETIERIDYRKGPYFADIGDFSAAGTVAFRTRDRINPFIKGEIGAFNFRRAVAGSSIDAGPGDLLVTGEAQFYDGPWVLDEDLERFTGLAKYSVTDDDKSLSFQLNAYDARWT